ncbi:MAG: hypothetical protein ACI8PZ_004036 [Myxococcota bacterium]|jgi:hypothetical protein
MLSLADGRTLVATVLATEALGVRIELPQGEMLVAFDLLKNMASVDAEAYASQPEWSVIVHAPSNSDVVGMLQAMPGIAATRAGEVGGPVDAAAASAIASCGGDVTCIGDHVPSGTWVVSALDGEDGLDLVGVVAQTRTRSIVRGRGSSGESLWAGLHDVLDLQVTTSAPRIRSQRGGAGPTQRTSGRSAFVPLPGYPAMGVDGGRVAAAWGVALPATALWVGAVGTAAQSPAEHVAFGLVGFYAITVATNHALAPKGDRVTAFVLPIEGGGATVGVGVRR